MVLKDLDSIAAIIALITVFLLPIFFVPFASVSFEFAKWALLAGGVLISFILCAVARLRGNSISIPKTALLAAGLLLPLASLVSALISGSVWHSLVGQGFEIDTTLSMTIFILGLLLGSVLFNSRGRIINVQLALIASFFIFFLFQAVRLILGPGTFSFDILVAATSNLLGKWNDVAIFSGLIALLSISILDLLRPKGLLQAVVYGSLVASLLLLAVVNFTLVWIVLASLSFLLLARRFLADRFVVPKDAQSADVLDGEPHKERLSGAVLLVFFISLLFVFAGNMFENYISAQFNLYQIEARPSWQSTFDILTKTYTDHALFGVGPNNFGRQWLLQKPAGINGTAFWDTDFQYGVGILPTFLVSTGLLGGLALLLLLGLFLWEGIKAYLRFDQSRLDNYLTLSSFLSALFLWVLSLLYVPQTPLFFFAFLFTGVFVASLRQAGQVATLDFSLSSNPKVGFGVVALLFVALCGAAVGIYVVGGKFVASVYAEHATRITGENLDAAERSVGRALLVDENDATLRAASAVSMRRLGAIVSQNNSSPETIQTFRQVLSTAVGYAQRAIQKDSANYQNWVALATVYEALIPLRISGAYDNAKIAYERAVEQNPSSPRLRLLLARTEAQNNNNAGARDYIAEALRLKGDYTDAIFLLSQIEMGEGKINDAIRSIEAASLLAPSNPVAFFQLGLLRYSAGQDGASAEALERAVSLNEQYSNARYFLGLSFYQLGKKQEALAQFKRIEELNKDNEEVQSIIANLVAGRAPFENFTPPSTAPQLRDAPPVRE